MLVTVDPKSGQLDFTLSFYDVGDSVSVLEILIENPNDFSPGGIFAKPGEELIIREINTSRVYPITIRHTWSEQTGFGVDVNEIAPFRRCEHTPIDNAYQLPDVF